MASYDWSNPALAPTAPDLLQTQGELEGELIGESRGVEGSNCVTGSDQVRGSDYTRGSNSARRADLTRRCAATTSSDSARESAWFSASTDDSATTRQSGLTGESATPRGSGATAPTSALLSAKARGFRMRVLRFTPSWFSVTMGTGMVCSLLMDLPWAHTHPAFRGIGCGFLVLDFVLFASFSAMSLMRYFCYPAIFKAMVTNNTHSLFLGTIPMGFVTIVTNIARIGDEYGLDTLDTSVVLWWVAFVMSLATSLGVPFIMFTRHKHTSEALTAAWLLPIVPPITVGASGSTLAQLLLNAHRYRYALTVLIVSYVTTGVGLLVACGIMVIYFQRLALHHLPERETIVSTFLPLGPCGQGGFALIELGRVAVKLFPRLVEQRPDAPNADILAVLGPALLGAGVMAGLLLWGLGMWWSFHAVMSVSVRYLGKEMHFNMGWWAFTFPLGSLAFLTFSLATVFDSEFFRVAAAIMTFAVVALWTLVFIPTMYGFVTGTLFPAPCLATLPEQYTKRLLPKEEKEEVDI